MAAIEDPSIRYGSGRTWGSSKLSCQNLRGSLVDFASINPLVGVEGRRYERIPGFIGLLEAIFCCSCGVTLFVNALLTLSITVLIALLGLFASWTKYTDYTVNGWLRDGALWDLANNAIAVCGNIFIIVAWFCRWERALSSSCPIMTLFIITYILAAVLGILDYSLYGSKFILLNVLSAWFWGICIYYVRQILQEWEYQRLNEAARASGRTVLC